MALPASEAFAGAAGNLADPPWTQFRPGLNSHLARNGSGVGTIEQANTDSFGLWNADTFSSDHYSQVTAQFTGPANGTRYLYLIVRASGVYATGNWYWFWTDGGSDTAVLRVVSGAGTSIGSANATTFTSGDVFKLQAVGSGTATVVTAYKNGSAIITVNDTSGSALSGGAPGVGGWSNGTLPLFDDWVGDNIATTASRPADFYLQPARAARLAALRRF